MRQYKYFALLPVLLSTGLHGARAEDEEDPFEGQKKGGVETRLT